MARHNDNDGPETLVGISFDDAFRAQEFLTAATRIDFHEAGRPADEREVAPSTGHGLDPSHSSRRAIARKQAAPASIIGPCG